MRLAVRNALGTFGLVAAVYGAASLTGGWLGTPPWWERAAPIDPVSGPQTTRRVMGSWLEDELDGIVWSKDPNHDAAAQSGTQPVSQNEVDGIAARHVEPRDGREWMSGAVVTTGLAVAAFGAWPRRRRPAGLS